MFASLIEIYTSFIDPCDFHFLQQDLQGFQLFET